MEKTSDLLTLQNVTKQFGALVVLSDVSMRVRDGELRAVIGPNGAGKTTLFNLISGLFSPTKGTIVFDGAPIRKLSPAQLVQNGLVRTFQITEIFPSLSVYQNYRIAVETALGLNSRTYLNHRLQRTVETRIEELLETTGQSAKADRIAGELAHGDQRVVEIGITLARNPRVLLLDEPTAGMGDEETERMVGLIRNLHQEHGMTMLFIEHDMDIIFGVADRITVLNNGHMLAEGTPDEISANDVVQAAYLGAAQ